jgi:hypothetical protein
MKKAVTGVSRKIHHSCVAHTHNLSVNDSIAGCEAFNSILGKCRFMSLCILFLNKAILPLTGSEKRRSKCKTVKKQKDKSKSGSSAKKTRNYLYHEQLMFLKKVSEPRLPHELVSKKARTETEVGMESDFRSPLNKDKRTIDNKEVNERMSKFLDSRINPEKENHHLSFFKGIIDQP